MDGIHGPIFLWSVDAGCDKGMAWPMLREHPLLTLLSVLIVLVAVGAFVCLPSGEYSAVGSLLAGVGSLLAVIWFSAGLFYQSRQLKEQREQFLVQFNQLREDARRSALTFARDIMREAEEKALKQSPSLKSINDLTMVYVLEPWELKVLLESKDPREVQKAAQSWFSNREGPSATLLRGIKDAAEIYFRSVGRSDIDYTKEADEFVYIYGPLLWKLPYFEAYATVATLLSGFMITLQPGRKAAVLAASVAMLKASPAGWVNRDKVLENAKQHRQANLPIPAIAEDL